MRNDFQTWLATAYVPIAGAETAPAEPAADAPPEGEPASPELDLGPLTERMDEVLNHTRALEERLAQPPAQPEAPETGGQEPSPEPDWQQFDPNDPNYIANVLRAEAQRVAQEAIGPEVKRMQEQRIRDADERRASDAQQMLEDYPELSEQKNAQALVQDAQEWAQGIVGGLQARGVDPQLAQQIVGEPAFLELVHLAAKTADRAGQENPAGQGPGQEVTLEGGGTPNAGGAEAQPLGEQIKAAGKPKNFWS